MGKRRTTEEQLETINKKQEQMKAQERVLKKRLSEENRKARTRRLIKHLIQRMKMTLHL